MADSAVKVQIRALTKLLSRLRKAYALVKLLTVTPRGIIVSALQRQQTHRGNTMTLKFSGFEFSIDAVGIFLRVASREAFINLVGKRPTVTFGRRVVCCL